jgi:DNA-binding MarR family transcriptional regulator
MKDSNNRVLRKRAGQLRGMVSTLQASTRNQMELTQLMALVALYEAGTDGLTITALGKKIGVSVAAAGRMAVTFSAQGNGTTKMAGWGVAESFLDYRNAASKFVRLTGKGISVVESMLLSEFIDAEAC